MSPQFANAKAGEVGDVAGLVGERINGWIRSYSPEATSSALKDGVTIKGRPVDWAWAIPGASEYLVVEFSDSHKQYVARTELPEIVAPAVTPAVAPVAAAAGAQVIARVVAPVGDRVVARLVVPVGAPGTPRDARTMLASPVPVIGAVGAEAPDPAPVPVPVSVPAPVQQGEPSGDDETEEPLTDLAVLADAARERVFAWIRSHPLNASSCALADGSHVPGRPVGWAWAIPGTVEFLVVEFSDGHKQYLSPADLPDVTR